MKTKLMSLIIILSASAAFAGQPTSVSDLAKNSRKPTATEMETKGSGFGKTVVCGVVNYAVNKGYLNPSWGGTSKLVTACKK